jgi:type 1 glutamine amidotransferase
MKNTISTFGLVLFVGLITLFTSCKTIETTTVKQDYKYTALIVTGQNNHYWKNSTPIFNKILEDAGIFKIDIAESPAKGKDMSGYNPAFAEYDVVVLDYNGDAWNDQAKMNFENYVKSGGGVVVIHAADNSFGDWEEYNKIIGLGGWGNRDENSGPYLYWKNGAPYKDYTVGRGGSHGKQTEVIVNARMPEHPIIKGMPVKWKHAQDELYNSLRGPAENIEILATALSDKKTKGSGKEEPVLFTIKYGEGRIFHTVFGHVSKDQCIAVQGSGFVYTLQRGTEWAASGEVTQELPAELPDENNVVRLKQYDIKNVKK